MKQTEVAQPATARRAHQSNTSRRERINMIQSKKATDVELGQSAKEKNKATDSKQHKPANTPAAFVPSIGKTGVENKSGGEKKWNGSGQGELFAEVFPDKVPPARGKRVKGRAGGVRAKAGKKADKPKARRAGKAAENDTHSESVVANSIAVEARVRVVKPIDIEDDVNEAAYKAGDYLDEAASFLRKKPALYLPKNQKAQLGQYIGMVIAYAGKAEIKVVPFKLT